MCKEIIENNIKIERLQANVKGLGERINRFDNSTEVLTNQVNNHIAEGDKMVNQVETLINHTTRLSKIADNLTDRLLLLEDRTTKQAKQIYLLQVKLKAFTNH